MNARLDGKFYATKKQETWGETSYCIRMTTDKQLHLSFDKDSISFAGFMLEDERDRYLAEWTDDELRLVRQMIHAMYSKDELKWRKSFSRSLRRCSASRMRGQ